MHPNMINLYPFSLYLLTRGFKSLSLASYRTIESRFFQICLFHASFNLPFETSCTQNMMCLGAALIVKETYTMNTIISVNWIWKEKYKNYFPVPFLLANRINWNELRRWKNSLSKVLHSFLSWYKNRFWEQNKKLYLTLIAYATDLHFVRHDSIFFLALVLLLSDITI